MKNRTIMIGLAAIATASIVTGGTFAAWSDYSTITGNETVAGNLTLNTNSTGSINNVGGNAIAPGESRTIDFFVASADLDGVPLADLSMSVQNLVDAENGCSSQTEIDQDGGCATPGNNGEFSQYGYVRIRYSNPAATSLITFGGNNCSAPSGYVNSIGYTPPSNNDATVYPRLNTLGGTNSLGQLAADQGVCIRIDLGLDVNAPNLVQGDSSTFDLRFDLTQVL